MRRCSLLFVLALWPAVAGAAEVTWARAGGGLTIRLVEGEQALTLGPELFGLRLAGGQRVLGRDLRLTGEPRRADGGVVAMFTGDGVTVDYRLTRSAREAWWRVQLAVSAPAPVVECDVVRLQDPPAPDLGGFGQPWYLGGRWFVGVEYPASWQVRDGQVVVARHHPGQAKFTSKVAVIGERGRETQVADAFDAYVQSIGCPRRSLLQYNSWYDLRAKEMTVANFARIFEQFQQHLLAPYGLRFGAFVPDDGWQNRDSIWEVDRSILPDEFRPLARLLEASGSRLGIWLPVNGTNLNCAWGQAQGYEVSELSDTCYSLVGPKYQQKLREVLKHRIADGNLAYFKHDFNNFRTRRRHPLGDRVDYEENLDAQLAIHAYERQLQPGIFLNITSGMWLSPWWRQHADTIWMAANDFGFENTWPQPSRRDWDMSYRDQHFYGKYRVERDQFPLSRLMTHGIIHGRLNRLGGKDETLREWSDMVVLYYARGVQLKELYVTPDLLDQDWWRVLGRATQWAEAHAETLDHTRLIGGEPKQGQVYGYVHWGRNEGIVAVRNPDVRAGQLALTLAERPARLGPAGTWRVTRVYPDRGDTGLTLAAGGTIQLPAPGQAVCLYHLVPATRLSPLATAAAPVRGTATVQAGHPLVVTIDADVATGAVDPEAQILLRSAAPPQLAGVSATGGKPAVRTAAGRQNVVWRLPLRPGANHLTVKLAAPQALFASSDGTLAVWARSGVGTSLPADAANLPVPMPPTVTVPLLAEQAYQFPATGATGISDADLPRVKKVRLRLEIFDSNGGPVYGQKRLFLNGRDVAAVPANPSHAFSEWHEVVIELTPEQAGAIGRANQLSVTNAGGDAWKYRGLAIAVQRPDGQWVATRPDPRVYCSTGAGWPYSEGEVWTSERSPEAEIRLPDEGR